MSRTLKVHLTNASPDLVHEFRNFGEDVYRVLRDECSVSIEEIDTSTRDFHLREIPKREVRTIAAKVYKLAHRYTRLEISADETNQEEHG
jgi:hypothetical protein